MTKYICTKCKYPKIKADFGIDRSRPNGLTARCSECRKVDAIEYRKNHIEKCRESVRKCELKKKYGITPEDKQQMYTKQDKKCKICNKKIPFNTIDCNIDHDHKTMMVRGLLCRKCNGILGFCDDRIGILENCIKYLIKANKIF